ncbi:TPA: hypothetical protein TZI89_000859 [Streptococcus suis]|uniref:DUF4352 domain-containing protein n=1 Tax=Streptococcus suis TaxID=1307 RepID=A0A3R8R762_STRSU|nr:hypothetical protein [Streptococcus suis]RRR43065.1 hypothetical protein EJA00_10385 [Streptococcus suis]HEL2278387.1 hypothetical protein [Streptococcus suis]
MKFFINFLKVWQNIALILLAIVCIVLFNNLNVAEQKYKKVNEDLKSKTESLNTAISYVTQTEVGDGYLASFSNFLFLENMNMLNIGDASIYENEEGSAEISILYAKKIDEPLYPTFVDREKYDLFVVGINVVNTGNRDISINPREFFAKGNDGNYLSYISMNETENVDYDGNVIIKKNSDRLITIDFSTQEKGKVDEVVVRYGATTWKY